MYESHTDGRLIAELSALEICESITQICNRIKHLIKCIEDPIKEDGIIGILNPSASVKCNQKAAEEQLKHLDSCLKNYVMEACLRGGMGEFCTEQIQKAYQGRTDAIESQSTGKFINQLMGL